MHLQPHQQKQNQLPMKKPMSEEGNTEALGSGHGENGQQKYVIRTKQQEFGLVHLIQQKVQQEPMMKPP